MDNKQIIAFIKMQIQELEQMKSSNKKKYSTKQLNDIDLEIENLKKRILLYS